MVGSGRLFWNGSELLLIAGLMAASTEGTVSGSSFFKSIKLSTLCDGDGSDSGAS